MICFKGLIQRKKLIMSASEGEIRIFCSSWMHQRRRAWLISGYGMSLKLAREKTSSKAAPIE